MKKIFFGEEIKLHVHSQKESRLFQDHEEQPFIEEIALRIEKGDVVFDIGAHSGYHAVHFAAKAGPEGQVIAVDANPACFQFLQENAAANPHLRVIPVLAAVSNWNGKMGIVYEKDAYARSLRIGKQEGNLSAEVEVLTLDSLQSRYVSPNLIKIDVEGEEHKVLEGINGCLNQAGLHTIAIEWHTEMIDGGIDTINRCRNILANYGFVEKYCKERRDQIHTISVRIIA